MSYRVRFGYCMEDRREFTDFDAALAFYRTDPGGEWGQQLLGDAVDADCVDGEFRMTSDGLTEEERETVEECL